MPWKETNIVDERMNFVVRHQHGDKMVDLAREFGISRKTGYKILARYRDLGPEGLKDQSRRPGVVRHATPAAIVDLVVNAKREKSTWGAKKIRELLLRRHVDVRIPARSTVHEILVRHDLVNRRKRRRRASPTPQNELTQAQAPNEVWATDYKGQFRLGSRNYCYPLTVSDLHSRFLLGCDALSHTRGYEARRSFELLFEEYGLPEVIRSDNGSPFASTGLLGLSRLSVWWMTLGIRHERIKPGCPQQNGIHERMHRTLKRDATRPAGDNLLEQQEKFDHFRCEFNEERPHEGIDMKRPADLYRRSTHDIGTSRAPEYPLHDDVRTISSSGHMHLWRSGKACYVTTSLAGQKVGLREVDDDLWLVSFMDLDLGHIDRGKGRFQPMEDKTIDIQDAEAASSESQE